MEIMPLFLKTDLASLKGHEIGKNWLKLKKNKTKKNVEKHS